MFYEKLDNDNTITYGMPSEDLVQKVWEKGHIISGNDKDIFRQDDCKAWINRKQYGNRDSKYGWEIDHIKPESKGGSDDLPNLRPLQWKNNAHKQDGKSGCAVTSKDTENVDI